MKIKLNPKESIKVALKESLILLGLLVVITSTASYGPDAAIFFVAFTALVALWSKWLKWVTSKGRNWFRRLEAGDWSKKFEDA